MGFAGAGIELLRSVQAQRDEAAWDIEEQEPLERGGDGVPIVVFAAG